jgi:transglutaminase/protease-like cytokinesis protein 3
MRQLFILFFIFNLAIQAQEYKLIDAKVKRYPKYKTAQKLANKIKSDFTNDGDKIRATFVWLAHNIRYDLKEYYTPTSTKISFKYKNEAEKQQKLQAIKDQVVNQMFSSRKSVCEGYAQSFKKVCDLLDIEAVVIKGYARNSTGEIGQIPRTSNHAWNAVKVDLKWQLIDATWAAGYAINNKWEKHFTEYYFYPKPQELLRTHLPDNTIWQLIKNPISRKTYANQPIIGQGFFSKRLQLIMPNKGVLQSKLIEFKVKNLTKKHVIGYQFKGQKYGKRVNAVIENGIGSFSINLKGKRNSEVYIFIDSEIALEYKIK